MLPNFEEFMKAISISRNELWEEMFPKRERSNSTLGVRFVLCFCTDASVTRNKKRYDCAALAANGNACWNAGSLIFPIAVSVYLGRLSPSERFLFGTRRLKRFLKETRLRDVWALSLELLNRNEPGQPVERQGRKRAKICRNLRKELFRMPNR